MNVVEHILVDEERELLTLFKIETLDNIPPFITESTGNALVPLGLQPSSSLMLPFPFVGGVDNQAMHTCSNPPHTVFPSECSQKEEEYGTVGNRAQRDNHGAYVHQSLQREWQMSGLDKGRSRNHKSASVVSDPSLIFSPAKAKDLPQSQALPRVKFCHQALNPNPCT